MKQGLPLPGLFNGASSPANGNQDVDFAIIHNPVTIHRMLSQMQQAHSRLTLNVEAEDGVCSFQTSIARINRKARQIIVHQLQPKNWQRVIDRDQVVEVNCFMPSGQLTFYSTLAPLDELRENYYCVLALPDEISKFQLRSSFRVFMPPGSCRLSIEVDGSVFEGVGLDLSLDGCCLRFIGDIYERLEEGDDMLRDLHFNLLDGSLRFTADVKICRKGYGKGGQIVAGVRFTKLPEPVKKQLQATLVEVQRMQLRQQVRIS